MPPHVACSEIGQAGQVLALYVAGVGSVLSTPESPLNPWGVSRVWPRSRKERGVFTPAVGALHLHSVYSPVAGIAPVRCRRPLGGQELWVAGAPHGFRAGLLQKELQRQ